jgi:hypothetical protein
MKVIREGQDLQSRKWQGKLHKINCSRERSLRNNLAFVRRTMWRRTVPQRCVWYFGNTQCPEERVEKAEARLSESCDAQVRLQLYCTHKSPGGLVKMQVLIQEVWGRTSVSNKSPGDTNVTDLRVTWSRESVCLTLNLKPFPEDNGEPSWGFSSPRMTTIKKARSSHKTTSTIQKRNGRNLNWSYWR